MGSSTSAALRELKATVGLLRDSDDDPPSGVAEPAPGLAQFPELIEACWAAGIDVTLHTYGPRGSLPPLVELTVFRVVQEALTNITKHAVHPVVTITLAYAKDTFSAHVLNTGARPGPAGSDGYGLIGMRERARAALAGRTCGSTR
ncbi:sensor histidine kinase [Actinoplanes sp. NBRC 103695]|uniref:sensor histidine kinase n=1 Tax=Actinoplanes sp. NBRC 103695 TaxID=3032202 RepID=UPI0024A4600B|nr:sensor histidine kinase [Actinoplanes sp. NBRC 103695]GLZ01229.1 hypothetical protein Acsp02_84800 [Actinoplanes sp. NBRC 103695]